MGVSLSRGLLGLIAISFVMTGFYIFFAPQHFYALVPGLAAMGPFSVHFIRDVALAYFASGLIIGWGTVTDSRTLTLAGTAWPVFHALFHVQIWGHRGFPFDGIFFFDLGAVMLPALAALALATTLGRSSAS